MKKLLVPILMLLIGTGSGVGAGLFLFPPAAPEPEEGAETAAVEGEDGGEEHSDDDSPAAEDDADADTSGNEFAKLANQFVVPLVTEGKVTGLVVMSISLEVPAGGIEAAYAIEPRLRDAFLQVLFDHANVGGFSGNFTDASNMRVLREELLRSAKHAAGSKVSDVLILDIVRQDI